MADLKKGDRVRLLREIPPGTTDGVPAGSIGIISDDDRSLPDVTWAHVRPNSIVRDDPHTCAVHMSALELIPVSAFKVGDRVRYTYQSPLGNTQYLPIGREGTVQPDPIGYSLATYVLFDNWQDPLRSVGNAAGVFLADNDDLELSL